MSAPTHPRETFDGYGSPLELGDWAYIVDDYGFTYGPGLWPFRNTIKAWDYRDEEYQTWESAPRLAPDVRFQSWPNEYVTVWPDTEEASGPPELITHAQADLKLTVRPQGMGAAVVRCRVDIDLAADTFTIRHDDLGDQLREQAETKARRIVELIVRERQRRDTQPSPEGPLTAHERYNIGHLR